MTKPISWRRQQLLQLARLLQDNVELIAEALRLDLGRPEQEAYLIEVGGSIQRCLLNAEKLSEWTKDHEVEVAEYQKSWKARYHHSPKGVVLIIVCVNLNVFAPHFLTLCTGLGIIPSFSLFSPFAAR